MELFRFQPSLNTCPNMSVCLFFFIYLLDYKMLDLSLFPYISNQQILKHVLIINVAMVNPAASVLWWLWYLFCRRWFLSQTHFMIFSFTGRYYFYFLFFLAFDFCRFCVIILFFHPRHNGQWPPTSIGAGLDQFVLSRQLITMFSYGSF